MRTAGPATRCLITDAIRDAFGPRAERCGAPPGPEPERPGRMCFEAALHRARTGCGRRDPPGGFGSWDAASSRLRRRSHSGRLKRLFERMAERPEGAGPRRLMIDSTIVRAHQHPAGAAKERGAPRRRPSAARAAG